MADLFRNQICGSSLVFPFSNKQFTEERVQRLHLLLLSVLIFAAVLLLERTQEPFQNQQRPFLWIGFAGRGDEQSWMLSPVRAVLDNGLRGEEKRRGSQRCKVAFKCC